MWWAFILTGMLTVFIYAKLWRRSEVLTDVEFYELRYSGKAAAFLRGFRAIYLGVLFNIIIMASVSLAAIKIGETMLGWGPVESVVIAMVVTVIFSSMGGFKGVILTDFLLFIIAMIGAFAAAYYAVTHPAVGGLDNLFAHEAVKEKISLLPTESDWSDSDTKNAIIALFVMPLLSNGGQFGILVLNLVAVDTSPSVCLQQRTKNMLWEPLCFSKLHTTPFDHGHGLSSPWRPS